MNLFLSYFYAEYLPLLAVCQPEREKVSAIKRDVPQLSAGLGNSESAQSTYHLPGYSRVCYRSP